MLRVCNAALPVSFKTSGLRATQRLGAGRRVSGTLSSGFSTTIIYIPRYTNSITTLDASRLGSSDVITLSGTTTQVWDRTTLARRSKPTAKGSWWKRVQAPNGRARDGAFTEMLTGSPWLSNDISTASSQFPHKARGWLYYYRPPSRPPTAGEVRFRLLPPTGELDFASGTDLSLRFGRLPYAIRLLEIATSTRYRTLANVLLRDQLISQDLLEHWKKQTNIRVIHRKTTQFLFGIEDPCIINLSDDSFTPFIWLGEDLFRGPRFRTQWWDLRKHMNGPAYTGQILCRLERSTLPNHAQRRVVVLRVLEIIEPIRPIVPDYDGYLEPPAEGALLQRGRKPVSIDIDDVHFKGPLNPLQVLCDLCGCQI
ncbi:hypothetical protein IEO21_06275 [Rhodonia placenta]|uniref:Uncharacterized protein n=1 Tax=Rhodonia placenta TaxID=104341 RepID=A0A8H7P0B4_9APHY|nr:hypothetical protein IEO21_06275 [Postia placenta]